MYNTVDHSEFNAIFLGNANNLNIRIMNENMYLPSMANEDYFKENTHIIEEIKSSRKTRD